jgi:hypothetical protein
MLSLFFVTGCSKTVKVDHEGETKTGMIEEVPKWYTEKKAGQGFLGKKDKFYVYGVGVATSPDLQLAMEKAKLIAKADIADILLGEINQKTQTYIEELGQDSSKQILTETNSTTINVIKNTKVQGYEQWQVAVSITPNKEYRVYMGLQLPLGEYNKLYETIQKDMAAQLNSLSKGEERFDDLEKDISADLKVDETLSAVPVDEVTEQIL